MTRPIWYAAVIAITTSQAAMGAPSEVERGRYLASIMDCATCHTDGAFIGKPDLQHPLAGSSIGHQIAGLGTFWPPNLTPDRQTGLGTWSTAEIVAALREGVRPDGRILAPAMPWRAYANLSVSDAQAIAAYLKSLPPTPAKVRPPLGEHDVPATTVVVVMPPKRNP